ncbi:hypothetical protein Leryth_024642 [Lithospermum erythrorhizon]|nr:hypothetical protein Leryth_024642 [Lithospermum erythrorhizon]
MTPTSSLLSTKLSFHPVESSSIDAVEFLDDSLIKHFLKDDEFVVVDWPPKDIVSELIQPFLLEKNGVVMDVEPRIHLSTQKHDLILFQELCVNNDRFFQEEDEEILCDCCIHPITASYYSVRQLTTSNTTPHPSS